MEMKVDYNRDIAVVSVIGSLDALTAPGLTDFFKEQLAKGHTQIVADLSRLEYTSSAGLRVLLGVVKETRQEGGDLRLAAVQVNVNKVLSLSGFTSILKTYPSVDEAVQSYNE